MNNSKIIQPLSLLYKASIMATTDLLDYLGSPTAVVGFGATTLVLLGTTYFFTKSKSQYGDGKEYSTRGNSRAGSKMKDQVEEEPKLDRTKYPGGHLTIYYGSQTGTAQMFAKQIASECETRGFCPRIVDLQDVVENDDVHAIEAAGSAGDGFEEGEVDEDGKVIRATLAHPHYRDEEEEDDDTNNNDGGKSGHGKSKALFLMATYGEGEPTDNAQQFVEMMKGKSGISNIYKIDGSGGGGGGQQQQNGTSSLVSPASSMSLDKAADTTADAASSATATTAPSLRSATFLRDLEYAVFGLGNKQYEHFSNMSRFMDAALEKCGARRMAATGLGDDDDDLEGDFENWKDGVFWPAMMESYVKGKSVVADATKGKENGVATSLPPCPYRVEYLKTDEATKGTNTNESLLQTSSKHYAQSADCPVVARRELRDPSDPGSTIHMEIDVSQHMDTLKYQTADNLGILPKNNAATVEAVAKALNYDLDRHFNLLPNNNGDGDDSSKHTLPFPTPCTVRTCLERYCDLSGPPRRSDLKQLAPYAKNDLDRQALLRMSSKEGKAEYKEKIVEGHVGIAEIVTKFCTSIEIPLEHFAMVCPRLQPRYYTISSSSSVHPTTIHITLAVLETEMKMSGKVFKGLCSGYLANRKNGDVVRVFVRDSTFRLPKQVERPVVMFGPGTGIAPMRAVLQERSHARMAGGTNHGPNVLYFGCKSRSMDYIYRDELEAFREEGTLTELHLAFSREQEEKVYVQHLLAKRAEETWELIHERKASIFVCGAVRMGADVDHALQDIISKQGNMTREKAKAYLDKMQVAGRFVQELWS
mmetsp:Transcript_10522/g.22941  ORF Transcript_10522/g.22941 Transcript_10522/m.22941 type:complete len:816 (-) Transcript_10522:245-2692(-)